MKLAPKLKVSGHRFQWRCPYSPELVESIKQIPGAQWDKKEKVWTFPIDCHATVSELASKWNSTLGTLPVAEYAGFEHPNLHDYQAKDVARILKDRARLLAYETGLGKTRPAIIAVAQASCNRVLVICPGTMRSTWVAEFAQHSSLTDAVVIEGAKDWQKVTDATQLIVTSYDLLKKQAPFQVDALIFDEMHHVKNGKVAKSKAALEWRLANLNAIAIGLTATPIANAPIDVWHQLTVLWPGRFGTYWQYATRYATVTWNGYGHLFSGISEDPSHQAELAYRLSEVASRVTKLEMAHLLQPLNVSTIRIPYNRKLAFRELDERWSNIEQAHKFKIDLALMRAADAKLDTAKAHVAERLELYNHVVVFTFRKDYAKSIADGVKGRMVQVITGEVPAKQRDKVIEQCRLADKSLLVATMDSIGEGLDLTYAGLGIIAELTYKPKTLNQVLGRFCRLSGKHSVDIEFLILESTIDEQVGLALLAKVRDMNRILKAGKAEQTLEQAFSVSDDDEGFLARVIEAANEGIDRDVYV